MSKALDNAYHSLLPKAGYPLAVLFIEVPQRSVDVNVHPRKIEIKFEDEGRMFKAVYKSVLDAIRPSGQKLTEVAAVVEHPERRYTMEPRALSSESLSATGSAVVSTTWAVSSVLASVPPIEEI